MAKSILVIGLGLFGQKVVAKLNALGVEVMAVDQLEELVDAMKDQVVDSQIGDCTDPDFIKSLDIPSFDSCIVAIGDNFQASLETTSLLKEAGAKNVISRASQDIQEKLLLRIGADHVVYPEKQSAEWTAVISSSAGIVDYYSIDMGGKYGECEVAIPKNWLGKTIRELDIRRNYGINIVALKREGEMVDQADFPEEALQPNETLIVFGSQEVIRKLFSGE